MQSSPLGDSDVQSKGPARGNAPELERKRSEKGVQSWVDWVFFPGTPSIFQLATISIRPSPSSEDPSGFAGLDGGGLNPGGGTILTGSGFETAELRAVWS